MDGPPAAADGLHDELGAAIAARTLGPVHVQPHVHDAWRRGLAHRSCLIFRGLRRSAGRGCCASEGPRLPQPLRLGGWVCDLARHPRYWSRLGVCHRRGSCWLIRVHEARASSRRARWLVRVRSSGWPFHQACNRIRLSAAAALAPPRRNARAPEDEPQPPTITKSEVSTVRGDSRTRSRGTGVCRDCSSPGQDDQCGHRIRPRRCCRSGPGAWFSAPTRSLEIPGGAGLSCGCRCARPGRRPRKASSWRSGG